MTNLRTIHVDWYGQQAPSFRGGPQLAYQGDHLSNMVVFDHAPELPNYYLLVEMKLTEYGKVTKLPPILLEGPYWVIPNYYTQLCQMITYQVCCKTESGDYEHHSAKFKGSILPVITHNGEPVDQSAMFDPYKAILDKRVKELVLASGDIQIDSEFNTGSTNPVQNKVVKAAIDNITGRLTEQEEIVDRLNEGGLDIKDEVIEAQITDWLNDHPEATTTVQDGAITQAKLSANLKKTVDSVNGGGMRLNPTYLGEWVLPYQYVPSTFVKISNTLYLLNYNRNGANGKLITVNLSNNTVVSTSDKYLNHCNSAAYVAERNAIYIAPSQKSASDGTISAAYGIIKYTADWSDYVEIETEKVFLAVSRDEVTGKVYAYRINGELYEINSDDSLTLIGTISVPNIKVFNQDIAIYNGFIYLSGYNHYYLYTSIETLDTAVYGTLSREDNFGKYIFDENESWEFYDGLLYCVELSKHREVQSFGFFVSMSYRFGQSLTQDETVLSGSQFTANIFSADASKFALSETRFLHPNQLNTCLKEFETLNIDSSTNFGDVYFATNLVINNNLVCDTLQMRGDAITFDPPNANKVVTIGVINVQNRGGRIVFGGPSGMTYNITSIIFGYSLAHVSIKAGITITPYQFGGLRLITPLAQPVITLGDQSALSKAQVISKTSQNITVPAGGSITKTYTDTVPYDTNWRVMFEYGNGGIIGTVGRTITGSEINMFVYLYNYTDADIVVNNFRLVLIPGQTV